MPCSVSGRVQGCSEDEAPLDLLPVLRALSDPNRLRILLMLRQREQCVCHLTEALGISQGTVSHHMAVLKRAGLAVDRRDLQDGRWVYYSLSPSATQIGGQVADLLDASQVDTTLADCGGR